MPSAASSIAGASASASAACRSARAPAPCRRPCPARRPRARVARLLRVGLARRVEVHVAEGRRARHLAIVDRDRLAARRVVHHHEAAAAEVAGLRQRDGEREGDGHGRIDRVAAVLSTSTPIRVASASCARDHALRREDRMHPVAIVVDRRLLGSGRRRQRQRAEGEGGNRRGRIGSLPAGVGLRRL